VSDSTVTTSEQESKVLADVPLGHLIGGEWRTDGTNGSIPVEDPATGETLAELPDAGVADAIAALDAACDAQESWAATPPRERGEILRRAFELVVARREEFALLITMEMGKPLAEARAEVDYGAEFLRWYSEEAVRVAGKYTDHYAGVGRVLTRKQPVGPCILITPWNFPLAMPARKAAPALAAGCTTVVKPAEQTPLTTLLFAQLMREAGLPDGVLNVITTLSPGEVVGALIDDGRARKLSFTGSTAVGKRLLAQCADRVMRTSMELGGNAPVIVFDDADLERAVEGAMIAKLRNGGESCTAGNRFYVHEGVAEEFVEAFSARMESARMGRGTDEGVELGPVIDERAIDKLQGLVDDARSRGARVLTGGSRRDGAGYFYLPTVLDRIPSEARILGEEIFGPVAPIVTFSGEDEVVRAAGATEYGLAAFVFTQDLDRALRMVDRLDTGMVGINQGIVSNAGAPFGGIKESGLGKEGGPEGIEEFLISKYVAIASPPAPPAMHLERRGSG
jgi:succinate-semialdehyde dehydrogenase/glutarate-semialdehyde dehydrogenase